MKDEEIARIAHAANSALRSELGQEVTAWEELDLKRQAGVVAGVASIRERLKDGYAPSPEESHARWMGSMAAQGWRQGENQNAEKKTHPNMVPYAQLPESERRKDALFIAIVVALLPESGGLASWSEKG